ncbi:MAG: heme-binding protein [Myxococcota bacterium]
MKRRTKIIVGVALATAGAVAAFALRTNNVTYDTPKYEVTERTGDIEIRQYAPYIVAETIVDGDAGDAGNQGFRILASYIFGGNQPAEKIAMTAPVNQAPKRIAMTAPVTQDARGERFAVQFMMPSEYRLEDLPKPNDARVTFREMPGRRLAAVRYSGTWSTKNYEANLAKLYSHLKARGFEPKGEPIWARYDPPFKPWFLRRNEILTEYE